MENLFIDYIKNGKIVSQGELRRAYMNIVMKTHPDAIGTDRLVNKFIKLTNLYEEAKRYLATIDLSEAEKPDRTEVNHRLAFFRQLHVMERLDFPYNYSKKSYEKEIAAVRAGALSCFTKWKKDDSALYLSAQAEFEKVRSEKPRGPYRKDMLYLNLRPVFHNIIAFHLTGLRYYHIQVRQNLGAVMKRLEERELTSLKEYIFFLIDDMDSGPALMHL